MAAPLATVGILSIGSMGLGIAKLLVAHQYRVITNVSNRSAATQKRAQEANLGLVQTDKELVDKSDYILSIVPPRDAVATASRIIQTFSETPPPRQSSSSPLYYLDLNAIAPSTASSIAKSFSQHVPSIRFIDGGIIGGPPSPNADSTTWKRPGIPLSGPFPLHDAEPSGAHLAEVLYTEYLGSDIGSASGLKCCFAALSKGWTALAIQSFGTAASLGVLPSLRRYLDEFSPSTAQRAAKGIEGCPGKAYRWVDEMKEIGVCFETEGGWREQARVFRQIAGVYEGLAEVVERRGGTEGMGNVDGILGAVQGGLGKRE
ncbi:6-phosphogluconate dehydrogenase C-terminal domain-like protein [Lophiostoma macrostomum CBS 122681]|uniref:6-phosphogluconate dehydrogenase C-terminal domain-like protein n=1 Tax=Lophiostoma macrostomum CBS 122681 TaxID=1314788 RepID=A0A6A6TF15_9PLEO|nr:6-phosphogluconate dehydrogenase C-terminal domain-like protein [Lophiostoma macrostomum CBS 122681]